MNKSNKKTLLMISSAFLGIATIIFAVCFFYQDNFIYENEIAYDDFIQTTTKQTNTDYVEEEYVSNIDFESLQEINSDIFAWIEIPDSGISYPILCSQTDNTAYLNGDMFGEYDVSGEIFIENYNQIDFSDPVTLIYGHNMLSGDKFGNLEQYYSDYEYFYQNNLIYVYFPNETKQYQIFAAVDYDTKHILYYNNFSNEGVFDNFIDEIMSIRSLSAIIDESVIVTSSDKLIILSTCKNNGSSRFLVLAVEKQNN